jgi:hypothetical protein
MIDVQEMSPLTITPTREETHISPISNGSVESFPTSTITQTQDNLSLPLHPSPSPSQLDSLISTYFSEFHDSLLDWDFEEDDINDDGLPDEVSRYYDNYIGMAIIKVDVTGDGVIDFVIPGWHGIIVVPSSEDGYGEPYWMKAGWSRASLPEIEIIFQDLTGDDIPEIIYNEGLWGGGTGLWSYEVNRSIIHCIGTGCSEIWSGLVYREIHDYNSGGLSVYRASFASNYDEDGNSIIKITDEGFSIHCCMKFGTSDHPEGSKAFNPLLIFPSIISIYSFEDGVFNKADEQIVSLEKTIESNSRLVSTSSSGTIAAISWEFNMSASNANDYCQIAVESSALGDYFGCRHDFTEVGWQDITGDGKEDIVITAYSSGYPYGPEELISDEICMHQRIIAYSKEDDGYRLIANIAGCVLEEDLFGVKLEDITGDGEPEIIAAHLITETDEYPTRAYKWNGDEFVMWSELPLWKVDLLHWFPK